MVPGSLGVRLGGLGDQCDIGAVSGDPLGDRQADAAAGARDEHGFAGKGAHGATLAYERRNRPHRGHPDRQVILGGAALPVRVSRRQVTTPTAIMRRPNPAFRHANA